MPFHETFKITQGPWNATIYGGWDQPLITCASGNLARVHMPDSIAEGEANAKAMAATPEMIAALLLAYDLTKKHHDPVFYTIDAALRRAYYGVNVVI